MSATNTTGGRTSSPPILPLLDDGLCNQAYSSIWAMGRALALDPTLDLRSLDAAAAASELTVAFAVESHLHADLDSGATRLARRDGALESSTRPRGAHGGPDDWARASGGVLETIA